MLTVSSEKRVRPPSQEKWCSEYSTKLHLVVRLQLCSSGEIAVTSLLLLLPGPLWPKVVILVKVLSLGQIDLFENYWYYIRILETI